MKIVVASIRALWYNRNMMVGIVIRDYRKQNKISVRELARRIGVEHTVLWRFENGKQIQTEVFVKLFGWLLSEADDISRKSFAFPPRTNETEHKT